MVDKNRKMRQNILQLLYDTASSGKDYLTKAEIAEKLPPIDEDVNLEFNLNWLTRKGYVKHKQVTNGASPIRISIKGIDHIEAGKDFSLTEPMQPKVEQLSPSSTTRITVQGSNYGPISAIAGQNNTINSWQQITDAFNKAYALAEDPSEIRWATKSQVMEKLKEMEEELRKKNDARPGRLEAGLEWLKEHTFEIASIVEPFVLKAIGA